MPGKKNGSKILLAAGLLAAIFFPTFLWMYNRWIVPDSYYSHGFLIPFVSIFLIWKDRAKLREAAEPGRKTAGWALAGFGTLLQIFSAVWRIYFTQALAFVLILLGISRILLSKAANKRVLFPILFLIFMIPLPLDIIANLNLKLKLVAAEYAVMIVKSFGIICVQDGSNIHFSSCTLTVGNVCSGLRSLISLLALGAIFAYMSKGTVLKKLLIFAVSFPVAVIANILRIVLLCFIAITWGVEASKGFFHGFSGIMLFIAAYTLLFIFEYFLDSKMLKRFMQT